MNTIDNNNNLFKKRYHWIKFIAKVILILVAIFAIIFFSVFIYKKYSKSRITIKTIQKDWESFDYLSVYEHGKQFLQNDAFNNTALTYYGYSCFFLSQSQNDTSQAQTYLDECINNLRIALYSANSNLLPQLQYMLGIAYFYKNTISTHYYSDLAIKYLTLAKQNGYQSDDISEYLGLSYASLGLTVESISSFTEALLIRESDSLLLSIAKQYYILKEYSVAKQYLYRIINNSLNDEMIIQSENVLGSILIDEEDYNGAFEEFNKALQKNSNSADAHYGIGIVYEKQGNLIKARSEWRQVLKIQVNHAGALKKLSDK
ncbi:MAG: tetratricopeptide repeat protein [Treponema sp.]|jgi:tetratricopeptide (TPR) repeat protein|nr:tetratricopeptide repeat protein [Treponema sp.]